MKIILTCLVCALCLGVLVRLDVTMLSGRAQAFFQETVAPVLHVDTTGSKLRNLFVPVLADSEVDTTGNRWDKVAVSTGMDTETAFSCETGSEEPEPTTSPARLREDPGLRRGHHREAGGGWRPRGSGRRQPEDRL